MKLHFDLRKDVVNNLNYETDYIIEQLVFKYKHENDEHGKQKNE